MANTDFDDWITRNEPTEPQEIRALWWTITGDQDGSPLYSREEIPNGLIIKGWTKPDLILSSNRAVEAFKYRVLALTGQTELSVELWTDIQLAAENDD